MRPLAADMRISIRFCPAGGAGFSSGSPERRQRQTPSAQRLPASTGTRPRACATWAWERRYSVFQAVHAVRQSASASGSATGARGLSPQAPTRGRAWGSCEGLQVADHGRAAIGHVGYTARAGNNPQNRLFRPADWLGGNARVCLERRQQAGHIRDVGQAELRAWPRGAEEGELRRGVAPIQLREAEVPVLEICRARRAGPGRLEAIDSYKSFARLHPTHEKVEDGYVAFRVAECFVKEMPDDFFLLPPAYEKDQTAVRDALRELDSARAKYPNSPYAKPAEGYRREVLRRLIEHEVYVARFYLERGHPKAAILRIESALRRYPDSGQEGELMLTLGETHLEMGQPARAKQVFERVRAQYGNALQAKRAELFLDFIRQRFGEHPVDQAQS